LGNVITAAEQQAAAAAENNANAQQAAAQAGQSLFASLTQLIAQSLASANSFKQLTANLEAAGVQFLAQTAQSMVPGPFGALLGGLIQFGGNLLLNREQKLPIKDGAMETRIINLKEMGLMFSAVRDRGEMAFSRQRAELWAAAARGG
jgi:hypothetical protein